MEVQKEAEEKELEPLDASPLNKTLFQEAWQSVAEAKKTNPTDYLILHGRTLYFGEDHTVTIKLENQILVDRFMVIKSEIGDLLRSHMGSGGFKLEAILMEKDEKRGIFTAGDKYQYLAAKYPVLEELKNKFGLDLDF